MDRRLFIKSVFAFSLLPTFKEKSAVTVLKKEEFERIFLESFSNQIADDFDYLLVFGKPNPNKPKLYRSEQNGRI